MPEPFFIPTTTGWESCWSIYSPAFGVVSFLDFGHANRYAVISCQFNLHFPDDIWIGVSFHMPVDHEYMFFVWPSYLKKLLPYFSVSFTAPVSICNYIFICFFSMFIVFLHEVTEKSMLAGSSAISVIVHIIQVCTEQAGNTHLRMKAFVLWMEWLRQWKSELQTRRNTGLVLRT